MAGVMALLGAAAMVAGVTLQWFHGSVVDREGFARISQELVNDPSVRDELLEATVEQVSSAIQGQDLGGGLAGDMAKNFAVQRVTEYIRDYAQSPQYVDDWNQALLGTHERNIASAGTSHGPSAGAPENLELYIQPMVDSAESRVEDGIYDLVGTRVELPIGGQEALGGSDGVVVVQGSATGGVFDAVVDATSCAPLLLWGGGVVVVLSVFVARHREWVLVGGGVGCSAAVLVARGIADDVTARVLASPDVQGVGRVVVDGVFQLLLTGMDATSAPWLWGGVGVGVIGVMMVLVRRLWNFGGGDGWYAPSPYGMGQRRRVVNA